MKRQTISTLGAILAALLLSGVHVTARAQPV